MAALFRAVAFLAALVAAVPSPQSLKSSLTILIDNDLQGGKAALAIVAARLTDRRQGATARPVARASSR